MSNYYLTSLGIKVADLPMGVGQIEKSHTLWYNSCIPWLVFSGLIIYCMHFYFLSNIKFHIHNTHSICHLSYFESCKKTTHKRNVKEV